MRRVRRTSGGCPPRRRAGSGPRQKTARRRRPGRPSGSSGRRRHGVDSDADHDQHLVAGGQPPGDHSVDSGSGGEVVRKGPHRLRQQACQGVGGDSKQPAELIQIAWRPLAGHEPMVPNRQLVCLPAGPRPIMPSTTLRLGTPLRVSRLSLFGDALRHDRGPDGDDVADRRVDALD
jgi:hypothetical protein